MLTITPISGLALPVTGAVGVEYATNTPDPNDGFPFDGGGKRVRRE